MERHHNPEYALAVASSPEERITILTRMVMDLFMEVEALRECQIQSDERTRGSHVQAVYDFSCPDRTLNEGKSDYQKAYLGAAYATHNSAGPGGSKVLERFYGSPPTDGRLRECQLMERLGFSEVEIDRYVQAAKIASRFT